MYPPSSLHHSICLWHHFLIGIKCLKFPFNQLKSPVFYIFLRKSGG
jgi:hypothetical protein